MKALYALATLIGRTLQAINRGLVSEAGKAEREHHRAELLAAYKRRTDWKKSDIYHLRSLGVNKAALRRMERLEGTGRPVVSSHQDLGSKVLEKLQPLQPLFDPNSTSAERKKAFKRWPWWPHYVEALYRGEHALAKERGIAAPSVYAERLVGQALGISAAKLHSICGEIRRMRKEWDGSANFPTMTLSEYAAQDFRLNRDQPAS